MGSKQKFTKSLILITEKNPSESLVLNVDMHIQTLFSTDVKLKDMILKS